MTKQVPNYGSLDSKIWVIGEAPAFEEVLAGKPFVGPSGNLLRTVCLRNGLDLDDEAYVCNLSNERAPNDNFSLIKDSEHVRSNIRTLKELLHIHKPNVVALLGGHPLNSFAAKNGITAWRGSILAIADLPELKCIPTFHPAYILRAKEDLPIFDHDIRRICEDRRFPEKTYPNYKINVEVDALLSALSDPTFTIASDIETTKGDLVLRCICFSWRSGDTIMSTVLFFNNQNEATIRRILESPNPKVFHYGKCFDAPVLLFRYGYRISNFIHDTIIQAHVLNPSFEKKLAYLTSIYTRQPYYKSEGKADNDDKAWSSARTPEELGAYCARDGCVTLDIHEQQLVEIHEEGLDALYNHEMRLADAMMDISQYGMNIDLERIELFRKNIQARVIEQYSFLWYLAEAKPNARSPKQIVTLLYETYKLPKKYNKDKNLTADEDAIIDLIGHVKGKYESVSGAGARLKWQKILGVLTLILGIRGDEKLLSSYINFDYSEDGRVRGTYKVHGTETGRLSATKYFDDTGINIQTPPRESIEVEIDG